MSALVRPKPVANSSCEAAPYRRSVTGTVRSWNATVGPRRPRATSAAVEVAEGRATRVLRPVDAQRERATGAGDALSDHALDGLRCRRERDGDAPRLGWGHR